jgi:hypothetical protein
MMIIGGDVYRGAIMVMSIVTMAREGRIKHWRHRRVSLVLHGDDVHQR